MEDLNFTFGEIEDIDNPPFTPAEPTPPGEPHEGEWVICLNPPWLY